MAVTAKDVSSRLKSIATMSTKLIASLPLGVLFVLRGLALTLKPTKRSSRGR